MIKNILAYNSSLRVNAITTRRRRLTQCGTNKPTADDE